MSYEFYSVEKKGPIAWVWLDRPDKKNSMNPPAWTETIPIFKDLDEDDDIRVVIMAGKGSCFSAGIDLLSMVPLFGELMEKQQYGGIKRKFFEKIVSLQEGISAMEKCRKPVIAAIHSYCIGGGLDVITACDIRVCTKDSIFSLREAAIGFVADVGVLQRIPTIVGQGVARELAYTAKDIDAQRAKEINLVNEVYENHEELLIGAEKMAQEIADNSPLAVQASKAVLKYGIGKSIDDSLKFNAAVSNYTIPSNDLMAAFESFAKKTKPQFPGT
ncbi:MAG TPA: crotonase/enoyl-CoA hydratase family protein [Spirochaetota bacterium]|nr:crotonase/enoyl-CoA hydratase family protein [Spirochaetota bacterium]HPJ36262.1 crotonase/enoyl-CoA hydratase family protein [Spirochaetota bacterium]